ncbi:MAG: GWxTD domain-containing protein [Acidobacteriota bacterium]|nr:GWxTD domain-containing protein [Acidobacteriota bacterium]
MHRFLSIMAFFFLIPGPIIQAKVLQESLSESSKVWLNEVVPYIITKAEKEFFLSLPNEVERGKFIESFWKKRDPRPETPENEFKTEYFRRIAQANKLFGKAGIEGWRTDRGKVYILLGPPKDIQRDMTPTSFSTSVFHGPREIWNYWGLSNPRLPYNLEFVFIDRLGTGNYVLERNVRLAEQGGQPLDLNASHYHFDTMEYMAEIMKNPFERMDELRGIITTQVTYEQIPFDAAFFYFKGAAETSLIPLAVSIPYAACTQKEIEGRSLLSLNVLIHVSDALGQVILERNKDIEIRHSPGEMEALQTESLYAQTSISLESATYNAHILVLDNFSGKVGTLHKKLVVPDFNTQGLSTSNVILYVSNGGENLDDLLAGRGHMGMIKNTFKTGDEMSLIFEAYHLTKNPESDAYDFEVTYEYFDQGQSLLRIPAPGSNQSLEKDIRIHTSFMLKNFKPGNYILRVKVTDIHSGNAVTKDVTFLIIR